MEEDRRRPLPLLLLGGAVDALDEELHCRKRGPANHGVTEAPLNCIVCVATAAVVVVRSSTHCVTSSTHHGVSTERKDGRGGTFTSASIGPEPMTHVPLCTSFQR